MNKCTQPDCIAREDDCLEDDEYCFWRNSDFEDTKKGKSEDLPFPPQTTNLQADQ